MTFTVQPDVYGGNYYTVHSNAPGAFLEFPVEQIENLDRFICSFRDEPFFMRPKAGDRVEDIPMETQWLGIRRKNGSYSVYFSMAFEIYRTCFYGRNGQLWVSARTGDDGLMAESFCAYYRIDGTDFYQLVRLAAESVHI